MKYWAIYKCNDIIIEEQEKWLKGRRIFIPYTPLFNTKTDAKKFSKRVVEPFLDEYETVEFRQVKLDEY